VPDNVAVCGLEVAASVTDRVAFTGTPVLSANRGRNRTVIVQFAPAAKVARQVVSAPTTLKSTEPVIERVMFVRGPVPEFVSVNVVVGGLGKCLSETGTFNFGPVLRGIPGRCSRRV
jgi:hypothetical protein